MECLILNKIDQREKEYLWNHLVILERGIFQSSLVISNKLKFSS